MEGSKGEAQGRVSRVIWRFAHSARSHARKSGTRSRRNMHNCGALQIATRLTMAEAAYAAAAATAAPRTNGSRKHSFTSDLFTPQPQSFTLTGALLLLEPLDTKRTKSVFLMSRDYLENWVRWAYQQPVPPNETDRVRRALKLVAEAHQFDLSNPECSDPGAIDNRELSIPGHPLLLRPEVEVGEPQSALNPRTHRRVASFNAVTNGHGNAAEESSDSEKVHCCVVSDRFFGVRKQSLQNVCVSYPFRLTHTFLVSPPSAVAICSWSLLRR